MRTANMQEQDGSHEDIHLFFYDPSISFKYGK